MRAALALLLLAGLVNRQGIRLSSRLQPSAPFGLVACVTGWPRRVVLVLHNGKRQDITGAANAYVGEPVRRSGSTTGLHSGTVLAVNTTVNYGDGDVDPGLH